MSDAEGNPHEHERRVWFNDCDPGMRLSVSAALRYFEEVAIEQCETLGIGFDYYHANHVIWIMRRWDLRFGAMPEYGETVTVRTQPTHCRKILAHRRFSIRREDGAVAVEGLSQWIHLDALRMRPKRIPADQIEAFGMSIAEELPWTAEVAPPSRGDHLIEFPVRPGDIDINGHVNNVRYVEWALETLPREFRAERRIAGLAADYVSETRGGAEIRATGDIDGETTRHAISEGDRVAAVVEFAWTTLASR